MKTIIVTLTALALLTLAGPVSAECVSQDGVGSACAEADADPSDGSVGGEATVTIDGFGYGSTSFGVRAG